MLATGTNQSDKISKNCWDRALPKTTLLEEAIGPWQHWRHLIVWKLEKPADKTVTIVDTGSLATQLVRQLTMSAKNRGGGGGIYVFPQMPSSVSLRNPTVSQ